VKEKPKPSDHEAEAHQGQPCSDPRQQGPLGGEADAQVHCGRRSILGFDHLTAPGQTDEPTRCCSSATGVRRLDTRARAARPTHQGGDPQPRRGAGCAGESDLAHVAQPLDDRLERRPRGHEGERPGVFAAMAPCEAISFMSPVLRLFTTTR